MSRSCVEFTANSRICKLRAFEASGLAFVVNFRLSEHSFNLDYKYLCAVSLDFLFCFFKIAITVPLLLQEAQIEMRG